MYSILTVSKDEQGNLVYGDYRHFSSTDMSNADVIEDRGKILDFSQTIEQTISDGYDSMMSNYPDPPAPTMYIHFRYLERYITEDGISVTKEEPFIVFICVTDTLDLQY